MPRFKKQTIHSAGLNLHGWLGEVHRNSMVSVLVVDDVEALRKSISTLLKKDPSLEIVGEASDGVRAVQMAGELQPAIILLDINLPRLDGILAGGWIRKLSPDSKIIFVSQEFASDVVHAAMEIGASGFVLKSDLAENLISAIRAAIRGEKFMSNELVRYLSWNKSKK